MVIHSVNKIRKHEKIITYQKILKEVGGFLNVEGRWIAGRILMFEPNRTTLDDDDDTAVEKSLLLLTRRPER